MEELVELVPFLADKTAKVRLVAAERMALLSPSTDAQRLLKTTKVIRFLSKLIGDLDPAMSRAVLSALINLSADQHFATEMLAEHVVSRLMDAILDKANQTIELYAILLANITRHVEGASKLLQKGEATQGFYVAKLVGLFCKIAEKDEKDRFAWVANVLSNVTQVKEARLLVLDKSKGIFLRLLPFIQHPNPIRQRGILGLLRNCLFESDFHGWLLGPEVDLLPKLLWPLRFGGDIFDEEDKKLMHPMLANAPLSKQIEADEESRSLIVDSLVLLTSTKGGRELMRSSGAYVIIREYDKQEKSDGIHESVVNLVGILKGMDEDASSDVNIDPTKYVNTAPKEAARVENVTAEDEAKERAEYAKRPRIDYDEEGDPIEEI